MRRVLILLPTLQAGGSERVIVNVASHLDSSRFRLTVCVVDGRNAVLAGGLPEHVEYVDLGVTRVRYAVTRVVRTIWEMKPDVVLSTLGQLNIALAMLIPVLPAGTRFVARESSIVSENVKLMGHAWLWRLAYRAFFPRFDAIICQSRYMLHDLSALCRIREDQAKVIYNPVDVSRIRQMAGAVDVHREPGVVQLVAIGRLGPEKGFDLLIDAMSRLAKTHPSLRLWIIGEGELRKQLQKQIDELRLSATVELLGFQANPYAYLSAADTLILSSRYEGLPNVVLEALACGKPVIATPAIGGTAELLEGVSGTLLTRDVSVESLVQAMSTFDFNQKVSSEQAAKYDARKIVAMYEDLLY